MGFDKSHKFFYILPLLFCLAKAAPDSMGVFDVTQYGAIADGVTDNSRAFARAWQDACKYQGSSILFVPQGTFLLGPTDFEGPCFDSRSPRVEIQGTLMAHPDLSVFKGRDWLVFRLLRFLEITGGGILDGQGSQVWSSNTCKQSNNCQVLPVSLKLSGIINAAIHDLAIVNSKGFHLSIFGSSHIDVYYLKIFSPDESPNTDGIHVSSSYFININSVTIGSGDDCISIGPGSLNLEITNVICGPGHGISVGSLGKYPNERNVIGVKVKNCTLNGATNGVRIKTWPGSQASVARGLEFENIVMNNVSNPIIIDQEYCPKKPCTNKPSKVQVQDVSFKNIRGTSTTPIAVKFQCSTEVPCRNVVLSGVDIRLASNGESARTTCANVQGITSGFLNPPPCF